MTVINGAEKGSALADIQSIPQDVLENLTRTDAFLDSSTGDLYSYAKEHGQWNPIGNTGLHKGTPAVGMQKPQNFAPPKVNNFLQRTESVAAYTLSEKRVVLSKQVRPLLLMIISNTGCFKAYLPNSSRAAKTLGTHTQLT